MRPKYQSARLGWARLSPMCALLPLSFALTQASPAFSQEEADDGLGTDAELSTPEEDSQADDSVAAAEGDGEADASVAAEGDTDAVVDTSSEGGLFESAMESDVDIAGGDGDGGVSLDFGGYVRGDAFVGVIPESNPLEPAVRAAYGELSLQTTARAGALGDAFAEMRLRYGQQLEEKDLFVDLREAYVNTYLGPFDIRLGKQIVVWGRADAFNPTNNVTPMNFRIRSPHEDDKRVGNVGARVYANFLPVRVEGIWMPIYEPTLLPEISVDNPDIVKFVDPNYPTPSIRNGTYAAKVHLLLSSFEASVSYLYGNAPLPGYDIGYVQGGMGYRQNTRADVVPTSYTHHVIGADFSTAIGDLFGLRGEAAYRIPIDYQNRVYAPRPDIQYVLGLDREFGSLNVIAQYMGRTSLDWFKANQPNGSIDDLVNGPTVPSGYVMQNLQALLRNRNQILFGQLYEVQHMATVRLEWLTLHETLSLSAVGMMNFSTTEWTLQPKVSYKITGNLSTTIGGEIYAGPDDTLFGWIDESLSSGYVELKLEY